MLNLMPDLCPLCRTTPADTDDHIFPQFLGGKRTVRTCSKCNNDAGASFEGNCSHKLAPLLLLLDFNGIKVAKNTVWREAITVPDPHYGEIKYDLLPGQIGMLSRTLPPIRNQAGKITYQIFVNERAAYKSARKWGGAVVRSESGDFSLDNLLGCVPVNSDMRRTSIKMLVCLAKYYSLDNELVCGDVLEYLYNDKKTYRVLASPRGGVVHSLMKTQGIALCIDATEGLGVLGCVSWFGFIRIDIVLNPEHFGPPVSLQGVLGNGIGETFAKYDQPLGIEVPEGLISGDEMGGLMTAARDRFNALLPKYEGNEPNVTLTIPKPPEQA